LKVAASCFSIYAFEALKAELEKISVKFGGVNRYGLIGANSCGKSTFMKILAGELEPSAGSVAIDANERAGRARAPSLRSQIATLKRPTLS
jgi:ATPase subunit of ABC transporter with duplicated ATPase domains